MKLLSYFILGSSFFCFSSFNENSQQEMKVAHLLNYINKEISVVLK